MELLNALYAALAGYQIVVILLCVFMDLGLGVAASLRTKTFDAHRLADFYQSQVLPDVIGYTVIHVAVKVAVMYPFVVDVLGDYSYMISEALLGIALAAIVSKLGKSVFGSIQKMAWPTGNA